VDELTVMYGNQRITLQPPQFAHIGRRDDNAVVISDPRVSREHLRVSWAPQVGWMLENLGQAGTFVSGQPVARLYLTQPVEARLAAPDGPAVFFSPAVAVSPGAYAPTAAAPQPAFAGGGAPGAGVAAGQAWWGAQGAPVPQAAYRTRTRPVLGRKAWFGPRRGMGWGWSPISREGRIVSLVGVVAIVCVAVLIPHDWWVGLVVAAALVIVAFLKGTSPGGAREREEYQALQGRRDGDGGA
jgi:hypothetical protein